MSSSYSTSKSEGWKSLLLRHETVLLLVLAFEWYYFNSVGPRFGTLDNTFDIVRHSVEIGLLALVMTPIILTGGIDLSVGSLLGLCAILIRATPRNLSRMVFRLRPRHATTTRPYQSPEWGNAFERRTIQSA